MTSSEAVGFCHCRSAFGCPRTARRRAREEHPAVRVGVAFLEGDGFAVAYWRSYWWHSDAIRSAR
ncbi:hypothetical protein ACFV3E_44885 [Streptomyces sp. NPDC059718]